MHSINNLQLSYNELDPGKYSLQNDPMTRKGLINTGSLSRINLKNESGADISILTSEGDRVTISTDSLMEIAYAGYNKTGTVNGQSVSLDLEAIGIYSESSSSISVEGDLNKEELADISKILGKLEELSNDFLNGGNNDITADTLELGDMDSISGLDASIFHSESITIEQTYALKSSETVSEPLKGTEKPHPHKHEEHKNKIKKMKEDFSNSLKDIKIRPDKLIKHLSKLMEKLLNEDSGDKTLKPKNKIKRLLLSDILNRGSMRPRHAKHGENT